MKKVQVEEQYPQVVALSLSLESEGEDLAVRGDVVFGTQWIAINEKSGFRFGIRRGEMRFDLKGAEAPANCRAFVQLPPSTMQLQYREESEIRREEGASGGIRASLFDFEAEVGGKASESARSTTEYKTVSEKVLIRVQGPGHQPIWVFKVGPLGRVLEGAIPNKKWTCLKPISQKLQVRVRFVVASSDIIITSVEHPWSSGSSKNKKGIIHALILKRFRGFLHETFRQAGFFYGGEFTLTQGEAGYECEGPVE